CPSASAIWHAWPSRCVDPKRKTEKKNLCLGDVSAPRPAASARRSSRRNLVADCEAGLFEPLFEQPKPVVPPYGVAGVQEERHAQQVMSGGRGQKEVVRLTAFPGQIFEIVPIGQSKVRNQLSHGFRLIGFELAKKKFLEGRPTKVEQSSLRLGEQSTDRRGRRVVNFQRTADPKAARFRPAPRIHVGIFDLVL